MAREAHMVNARTLAELRGVTALLFGSMVAGCAHGSELESGSSGGGSSDPAQGSVTSAVAGGSTANVSVSSAGTGMGEGGLGGGGTTDVGSQSVTTTVSSAASTGTGGTCDGAADCQSCQACSIEGACAAGYAACLANLQCGFYGSCRAACSTDACIQGCQALYPLGVPAHEDLAACVCGECSNDCAGSAWGC